jgi:hypothetical protein
MEGRDLMLTRSQIDRKIAERALKAEALTPQHSAAEAAVGAGDDEDAKRRRDRVRHEADPYPADVPEVAEVDLADLGKRFTQAADVPEGYPPMRPVHAEDFRRAPIAADHQANSPGYAPPGQAVPVPSATLSAGMITRPLLTDGQSRPCATGAC